MLFSLVGGIERRGILRLRLPALDGVDADDVILCPERARAKGLIATVCFPVGNLASEGSMIKSTSTGPALTDADEVYRHGGWRGFTVRSGDCRD